MITPLCKPVCFALSLSFSLFLAQIFYQYFPSLLDINSVHFEVGVTPKVRTTETADAFIRSLVELQLKSNAGNVSSHQKQQQQLSQEQLSAGVEGNVQREREREEKGFQS